MTTLEICKAAKAAAPALALIKSEDKNKALELMAAELSAAENEILAANELDIEAAKSKISAVMIDRLRLDSGRISAMAEGICALIKLPDPVGRIISSHKAENGLQIDRVSVPFGAVAIIYESRPNVTSDAAALCIKSGNACILRSGRDAHRTASAIARAMKKGLEKAGLSADLIGFVEDTSRDSATELMTAEGIVDLLIPRGGKGLIDSCVKNATVPVIATGTGICHIFVDESADIDMALDIIENAKTSRPSVCNAAEVLLVHKDIAARLLPRLNERLKAMRAQKNLPEVTFKADKIAAKYLTAEAAEEIDFNTEFLDYILAVRVVDSAAEAVSHINSHSTGHSECIITNDESNAQLFTAAVDSAAVYVNASTRFTDGGEFGFGCEMGISTQKLHARGPMGLPELNTYKYVIRGGGQVR